ncbi:hypothetical protein E2C01_061621 [Portunus trituberculatus]|uniref:Uncharacterized protein n=1 Tax=Portunus trituberculatus TaxID=210409 RepID=A0A5B7HBR5_PORTR|nr:hypothetical protein [Portunus trituberculatus]
MLTKALLLLAGVCVSVRAADDVTTTAPSAGVTPDPADDFSVAILIATAPDEITTTTPPTATPPVATVTPDSTSIAPSLTAEDTPVIPAEGDTRVLRKRSGPQPRLLSSPRHIFGGGGQCSPPTATRYLTITSTHVIPSVTYATAINYIPTTISQVCWVLFWCLFLCYYLVYTYLLNFSHLYIVFFILFRDRLIHIYF